MRVNNMAGCRLTVVLPSNEHADAFTCVLTEGFSNYRSAGSTILWLPLLNVLRRRCINAMASCTVCPADDGGAADASTRTGKKKNSWLCTLNADFFVIRRSSDLTAPTVCPGPIVRKCLISFQ